MKPNSGGAMIAVLIIIAIVALCLTNPSEDHHKTTFKALFMMNAAAEEGFLAAAFSGYVVDTIPLAYNNYFLFSTLSAADETVSVGFLGYVMVTADMN